MNAMDTTEKKQRMNYPEWKESLHISHEALVYDEKVGSYWIKLEDMQGKSEYTDWNLHIQWKSECIELNFTMWDYELLWYILIGFCRFSGHRFIGSRTMV